MKTYRNQLTGTTAEAKNKTSAMKKLERAEGRWIDPQHVIDVSFEVEVRGEADIQGDDDSVYLKAAK